MDENSARGLFASASPLLFPLIAPALVGCAAELPPPAPPAAEMPAVQIPRGPLPSNRAYVVLDTPGEPAMVKQVVGTSTGTDNDGHSYSVDVTKDVCTTPCVHDFRLGGRTLEFESLTDPHHSSRYNLQLTQPVVIRLVMEQNRSFAGPVLGIVAGSFGVGALATGIPLLLSDTTTNFNGRAVEDKGLRDAGLICIVGGAALGATSLLAFIGLRGKHRVPASTEFPLPASASYTTGSAAPLTFRF